jgi:3-dehydroquinate synthetase
MLFALRLAVRRGLPRDAADRIRRLIARFDLPALPAIDAEELLRVMTRDKKARQEGPVWVLPTRLGEGRSIHGVEAVEVRQELRQFLRSPQARP